MLYENKKIYFKMVYAGGTQVTIEWPINLFQNKWIPNENILFAVKTCSKFHSERVPVIKSTWSRDAKHIRFYSDVTGTFCLHYLDA